MRWATATVFWLICSACSTTASVEDAGTMLSFNENGLTVGAVAYSCNRWIQVPDGDPLILDFFFSFDAEAGDLAPDPDDVDKLMAAGATIIHRFNVAAVRAEVPRDSISRATSPTVNHVRSVLAADRFDLWIHVGYLPEAEQQIQQRVLELGGHIESTLPGHAGGVPSFLGVLPDSAVAQLRGEFSTEMVFAEHEVFGCLAGA